MVSGGSDSIYHVAGKDGTTKFDIVHTIALLEDFEPIGVIET